tara:strand:- start:492 stop:1271 length:780 start_codon:yes stop_codon:yes gene_type:complete
MPLSGGKPSKQELYDNLEETRRELESTKDELQRKREEMEGKHLELTHMNSVWMRLAETRRELAEARKELQECQKKLARSRWRFLGPLCGGAPPAQRFEHTRLERLVDRALANVPAPTEEAAQQVEEQLVAINAPVEAQLCFCLETVLPDSRSYCKLSCGHEFHKACASQWITKERRDGGGGCPKCRTRVTLESTDGNGELYTLKAADFDHSCESCEGKRSTRKNQLLICDKCDDAYHQKCTGVSSVPDEQWFCTLCLNE